MNGFDLLHAIHTPKVSGLALWQRAGLTYAWADTEPLPSSSAEIPDGPDPELPGEPEPGVPPVPGEPRPPVQPPPGKPERPVIPPHEPPSPETPPSPPSPVSTKMILLPHEANRVPEGMAKADCCLNAGLRLSG